MNKVFRIILLSVVCLAAAVTSSFGMGQWKPKPPVVTNTPPVSSVYPTQPKEVLGIGRDYTWTDGGQPAFMAMLAKYPPINATSIEYAGWTLGKGLFLYRDGNDKIAPHYKKLVKDARAAKKMVIVSVLNDNKGAKKYGDDNKRLDQYKSHCDAALKTVLAEGPEGVWVQVMAETQSPYGAELEKKWIPIFKAAGFKTINNNGSRPQNKGAADYFAWHNCSMNDYGKPGCILIPDCGSAIGTYIATLGLYIMQGAEQSAISLYTVGGINGKTLNAGVIEKLGKDVGALKDRGLNIYTAWMLEKVDESVVQALVRGWKAGRGIKTTSIDDVPYNTDLTPGNGSEYEQ